MIEEKVSKTDIFKVPLSLLRIVDGFNIRQDMGDMKTLVESIRVHGIIVPLRGYLKDGLYFITAGHRRYTAAKALEKQGVDILLPFMKETKNYSAEQRIVDTFLTNEGKPLNPIEQAEGILRLLNYGWTYKDIAQSLSKSEVYIRRLHSLKTAPMVLQKMVISGKVSGTLAMDVLSSGEDAITDLLNKISGVEIPEQEEEEETTTTKNVKIKKITKKDLTPALNSFKEFMHFASRNNVVLDNIQADRRPLFLMLQKIANNEVTESDIEKFFYF